LLLFFRKEDLPFFGIICRIGPYSVGGVVRPLSPGAALRHEPAA
jgi:hypothetical protein